MRRAIAYAVAAIVVAVGLVALLASLGGGPGRLDVTKRTTIPRTTAQAVTTVTTLSPAQQLERDTATTWEDDAEAAMDLASVQQAIKQLLETLEGFRKGTIPGGDAGAVLDLSRDRFVEARDAAGALRTFPFAPSVGPLYQRGLSIYADAEQVWRVVVTLPPGDLRDQADRTAKRLKVLADRTFDRGRVLVSPHGFLPDTPDVTVILPEEVPDWVAEGLAAGPPLDPTPPPAPPGRAPDRRDTRPTQPRAAWLAVAGQAGIPSLDPLLAALAADPGSLDPAALGGFARLAGAAAERLRPVPDPDTPGVEGSTGREDSARSRIALLLDAEAGRILQLAALDAAAARPTLVAAARRILVAADALWLPDLPARTSGLPATLLTGPVTN